MNNGKEKLASLGEVGEEDGRTTVIVNVRPQWEGHEIGGPYKLLFEEGHFPRAIDLSGRFEYDHFHISSGAPCWGGWFKPIEAAVLKNNFFSQAVLLIELLENPSYDRSFYADISQENLEKYLAGEISYWQALDEEEEEDDY